jgi:signal transduction histidine kinase
MMIWGRTGGDPRTTRTARETGLPWTLHVFPTDASADGRVIDSRRNLFVAGFTLMALVICAAGYFVFRAVARELAVARLQSDFVAAVSHEFRTPLTAMCHLTEMLEDNAASPNRLPDYYRALGRESRRLRAMVENLLDFGRIDAGRRIYEFEEIDAIQLVARVAQEYTDRSPAVARRIEQSLPPREEIIVRADGEALALAVRNLLDNAMKYSPESAAVRLAVARSNGTVAMSIEDRGAGIGPHERRDIFRKFSRGAAAKALNVKGTGIGLTMAEQIVKAHGGRLELQSEPGRGSTFTIVLPPVAS